MQYFVRYFYILLRHYEVFAYNIFSVYEKIWCLINKCNEKMSKKRQTKLLNLAILRIENILFRNKISKSRPTNWFVVMCAQRTCGPYEIKTLLAADKWQVTQRTASKSWFCDHQVNWYSAWTNNAWWWWRTSYEEMRRSSKRHQP